MCGIVGYVGLLDDFCGEHSVEVFWSAAGESVHSDNGKFLVVGE